MLQNDIAIPSICPSLHPSYLVLWTPLRNS